MLNKKKFSLTPLALAFILLNSPSTWAATISITQTWKTDGWAWDAATKVFSNSQQNPLVSDAAGIPNNSTVQLNINSADTINIETGGCFISVAGLGGSGKATEYSIFNKIGTVKTGAVAINLTKQGTQTINANAIGEIIADNTATDISSGVSGLSIIYTGGSASNPKANQTIGGSFSLGIVRGTTAGKGFGISLKDDSTNSADSSSQTVNSLIGSLGTGEFPLNVGVLAQFKDPDVAVAPRGTQTIKSIGTIYATEAGVVNFSGTGQSVQKVNSVNRILVDSTKAIQSVPILAGIAGETRSRNGISSNAASTKIGQLVKVKELISVEGNLAKPSEHPGSNVSFIQDESQIGVRAGVLNRGGKQEVDFMSTEAQGTTISVGTNSPNDAVNYAVLVYPLFSQSVNTTSGQNNLKSDLSVTDTTLKGSFNVINGDIAVFGPQVRKAGEEHYLKVGDTSLTLANKSETEQSALTLGSNSNLWITNRSFDTHAGHGLARTDENTVFSLAAGSNSDASHAYQINLLGNSNFIYVDGTYKGNSTINIGSTWNEDSKSVSVNKNPIVIKNIGLQADNSKSHLNLNVNLASTLPASERDKFFDSNNVNIQVLMRQTVENLMIAEGTENLETGGLIITGDQVDIGSFSESGQNLALKDTSKGVNSRTASGYVTVTTPEGLITPQKTFVSEYYLDNSDATGKDVRAVLTALNDKVNSAAAELHGNSLSDTFALTRAGDDESAAYSSGAGAIYSSTKLPTEATTEIANNPPQGEDSDTGKGDSTSGNTSSGNNNSTNNHPTSVEGKTSTMASLESVGLSNYFVWREDVETLSQRLGEVRMTPELEGMWVRVLGGKNKFNRSSDYFSNKFYGVQLGVDRNIGGEFGWTVGAAFSYIDGDAKLANGGKDDNYFGSFSLYATKQFQNAGYLDIIAKFSRMHNDFTAISNDRVFFSKGKYSTNAYQFGVEYGKKFTFGQNWFVDPQVQLTYGHINEVSYKTNTGVNAKVKGLNSFIGRVGVASGYQNNKISGFIRIDALRDFTAKYKADYQVGNVRNQSTESLKDTWGEISAGTTANFGKNVKGYAQIKRSFAAKVKQEYRADVGLRLVF